MKKANILAILFAVSTIIFAGNYRTSTTGNTGQKVKDGRVLLSRVNVVYTGTLSAVVRAYNFKSVLTGTVSSVPSFTTTPTLTMIIYGSNVWTETYTALPYAQYVDFSDGLYLRTTYIGVGSYTTTIDPNGLDSYTVSPATPPIIEIKTVDQ